MRVAALGDVHCKKTSTGAFQALFASMAAAADVLVLCGDLTDLGLAEEARVLVKELGAAKTTPIVAVLGNHDYESGETEQVKGILTGAGQKVEREPVRPSTTSVCLCSSRRLRSDHRSASSTSTSWWPLPPRSARPRASTPDGRERGSR